ncbi:MAG: undecaprenyl-diphosphate phosphatase [Ruminococcaceae bacterium]|nr:undecaprenyl-diphosphate phosphatase [Oscillospiraceae bacterium]
MSILKFFQAVILGIVEGITEWLPISSTGHMILVNEFMGIDKGDFFDSQIFLYVIQLGAILAIATLYFNKLNPFAPSKSAQEKTNTWHMWFKVIVACVPAAILGLLFNDAMDSISTPVVVSIMLIVYGIAFIVVKNKNSETAITDMKDMTYKTALIIGLFQVLSIIPGTSRSGSTIIGAILIGCSRSLAAEFSFFLAIPVMFGVSFLKIVTNDYVMTNNEWILLIVAMVVAYVVSLLAVKFLMNYVKRHDFKLFGWYRVALGIAVLAYFYLPVLVK